MTVMVQKDKKGKKKREKASVPAKRLRTKKPGKHCNGITKQRVGYCQRPAGWGTEHAGQGRCKLHGGKSLLKHGAYSAILPVRFHELLENVKPEEVTDLTHEMIRLKTLLIELSEADEEDGKEVEIKLDKDGDPIAMTFSGLSIHEKIDYVIKITSVIVKTAATIEANRERAAKRDGYGQEFLKFIKPIVDAFYEELVTIVRDKRISREDFPKVHKERMEERPDFN